MGRPGNLQDLTGQKYNHLLVIGEDDKRTNDGKRRWKCKCDCGNTTFVTTYLLKAGKVKSCGCLRDYKISKLNYKHGDSGSRLFTVWSGMRKRCENTNADNYAYYGGKGISVCDEWKDYSVFKAWAESSGYDAMAKQGDCTIERIDSNKNYCPENCKWVSMYTQNNNKSNNKYIKYNGETLSLSQWSKKLGGNRSIVASRIRSGWDEISAITTPVTRIRRHR